MNDDDVRNPRDLTMKAERTPTGIAGSFFWSYDSRAMPDTDLAFFMFGPQVRLRVSRSPDGAIHVPFLDNGIEALFSALPAVLHGEARSAIVREVERLWGQDAETTRAAPVAHTETAREARNASSDHHHSRV